MKNFLFFYKSLFRWLTLSVFLFGSVFTPQTVQAATSPCSMTPANGHYGLIAADETWCASTGTTHYITDHVTVQAGVTLTIEPGVTVTGVKDYYWNYLVVKGHLDILGTAAQPVLLTMGVFDTGGGAYYQQYWGGIYFDGSAGDGSGDINYATIEYAGSNFSPPGYCWNCGPSQFAVLVQDLPAGKQVNISHSTIRNTISQGLYVDDSTVNVTDTTFSQNIYPILIEGADSVVTYSGNTFFDNAYPYYDNSSYTVHEDSIFIAQDALMGQDFSLPAQTGLDAYVFMSGSSTPGGSTIPAGRTMTVEPGVTLRTYGSEYLIVKGHLEAIGTQALPIRFTGMPSSNPTVSLNWGGLYFDGSAGDGSGNINYATIEYAYSPWSPNNDPALQGALAVYVRHLSVGKQVNISNSTIRNNPLQGLYVDDSTVNVTNTTFSQNVYPIVIEGVSSVVTYSGNTFSDNAYRNNAGYTVPEDAIFIMTEDALMGQDFSLPVQTGLDAYVFWAGSAIPAGRTMTVDPGVTLRTESGNKFLIVKGHLEAVGTQALPIRFTGIPTSTVITNWGGLIFDGPSGASGRLEHAIVEYGCGNWNGYCATLMIYNLAANKSVLVEHSTLQNYSKDSYAHGTVLALINSPTAQVDNNLIKGGGYGVDLATNMTISNLAVTDQDWEGVYVEAGYSVEARHLTIARTGRSGFYVDTGGIGVLKNSILSHNGNAVWAEGTGQASLETNLSDANTTFMGGEGTITELNTINGSATFEADGYHIQTTSDAVGIGLAGLSVVDIDGDARPMPAGSLPDLGADEVTDVTAPVVASITRVNLSPTNLASVDFTVTFSEAVSGVDKTDFSLATTGIIGASVTGVSGSGATRTVSVNTGMGSGTLRLDVLNDGSITDVASNPLSGGFTGGQSYDVQKTWNVAVTIGGAPQGYYNLAPGVSTRASYAVNNGPVKVQSLGGTLNIASERVAYNNGTAWTSYSELMGLPKTQLTDTYYFPWYNNLDLNTQVRFANVGTVATTVTITIGGVVQGSYSLAPGVSTRQSYAVNNGPVQVKSSGGVPIIASERVAYNDGSAWTSYSEIMGLPKTQLTDTYYFAWYNNLDLNTQVRFANVGTVPTTVTITIGGVEQGSYYLAPGVSTRQSYAVNNGPMVVKSSGGVPILASERVAYKNGSAWTDYSEMMGLPKTQLTDTYLLPWYNNIDLNTQVRFANVGTAATTVTVTIGGVVQGNYSLAPGVSTRASYVVNNGPIQIKSSGGVPIIASERVAYNNGTAWTSFSELMGLPKNLVTDTYYFPWYNNLDLNTQMRFGVP